uniref:Uncharacterized protein n=1 Tax=Anguilla anguilla TaxID=7936 RepID=A0A0E9VLC9_ANGAN
MLHQMTIFLSVMKATNSLNSEVYGYNSIQVVRLINCVDAGLQHLQAFALFIHLSKDSRILDLNN